MVSTDGIFPGLVLNTSVYTEPVRTHFLLNMSGLSKMVLVLGS